jgi:hypothetical protein
MLLVYYWRTTKTLVLLMRQASNSSLVVRLANLASSSSCVFAAFRGSSGVGFGCCCIVVASGIECVILCILGVSCVDFHLLFHLHHVQYDNTMLDNGARDSKA